MGTNPGFLVMNDTYTELFATIHAEYIPYYRSWCHDIPIIVTPQRDEELHRLQELLYRSIVFYARHFEDYLDLIPYDEKVLRILEYAQKYPFYAGTFRPDYVVRDDGALMVCEITSRFFGNGYFMSYFMEAAGKEFADYANVTDRKSYFEDFFAYMARLAHGYKKMVVLKSADKSDSIKLYVPFYRALGLEVRIIEANRVEQELSSLEDTLIISALNQKDLLSYSWNTLKTLIDLEIHNDLRTVFLVHDKRLFSLFFTDSFTARFLPDNDTLFLRNHLIPTYLYETDSAIWEDAARNKDEYIIKHPSLGKSEQVYAGCLTGNDEWTRLFASGQAYSMILQPFIHQKVFCAHWQEKELREYLSPSILCVDDRYFGTALFRTSSCPVINQTDAHKIAPILSSQIYKFQACHIL
ncbi:MAG: hypothetical protein IKE43_05200 [Coriobacteriales bacterium]|nr:hypothetical protein [Coriobacteriales bacterium]